MVKTEDMREFALDCLHWAERASNASDRQTMLRLARMWMDTASGIERYIDDGWELACPDLRTKLN